jgi:hypothetical protein
MTTSSLALFIFYLNLIFRFIYLTIYMYRKICVQLNYEAQLYIIFGLVWFSFMNAKMHKYASRSRGAKLPVGQGRAAILP